MDPVTGNTRTTFTGLASGLDTSALVETLIALERQPLDRLQARRSDVAQEQSLLRDLNTKLLALRDAAGELDNRNRFGGGASFDEELLVYTASSTDESIVTATAENGANAQDIEVEVKALATAARRFSNVFGLTDTVLASGQDFTLMLANDNEGEPPTTITVDGGTSGRSLVELRDLINSNLQNEDKVRAELVQVSDDEYRLMITAEQTGTNYDFSPSGSGAGLMSVEESFIQSGANAFVTLFGAIDRESQTNEIEGVAPGVTLQLHGLSEITQETVDGEPVDVYESHTVGVGLDAEAVEERLKKFVDAYNSVMSFIDRQQKLDPVLKRSGPLGNDATVRSIKASLIGTVTTGYRFSASPGNPFALGDVGGSITGLGIELDAKGRLSIDSEKFAEALAEDALGVREFLSGSNGADGGAFEPGVLSAISSFIDPIVQSGDGLLAVRDNGFDLRLDGFDDSIERFERRLANRQQTLVARFTRLEVIIVQFQTQASFLGSLRLRDG